MAVKILSIKEDTGYITYRNPNYKYFTYTVKIGEKTYRQKHCLVNTENIVFSHSGDGEADCSVIPPLEDDIKTYSGIKPEQDFVVLEQNTGTPNSIEYYQHRWIVHYGFDVLAINGFLLVCVDFARKMIYTYCEHDITIIKYYSAKAFINALKDQLDFLEHG